MILYPWTLVHDEIFVGHFLVNVTLFSSIGWSNGWIIAYSSFNCKSSVCSYCDDDFIFRLWNIECLRLSLFAYLWINNNNQHKKTILSVTEISSATSFVLNVPIFNLGTRDDYTAPIIFNSRGEKCPKRTRLLRLLSDITYRIYKIEGWCVFWQEPNLRGIMN